MRNGDVVEAYGFLWEILDLNYQAEDGETGILCLMKEPVKEMAFSENNDNDYESSDVKGYLESLTAELCEKGASFRRTALSMAADDGTGWEREPLIVDGLFLLTADMYRKYRKYIGSKKKRWWLASAYSFNSGYSYLVRLVDTDGTLGDDGACYGDMGVSPACVFSFLPGWEKEEKSGESEKTQEEEGETIV